MDQARHFCNIIPKNAILGFDTEWKPNFEKNKPRNKVALIQICYKIEMNANQQYV